MKEKLDAGEITEQQYKQWRLAQIGRGKRFEALRDKVAERYTDAMQLLWHTSMTLRRAFTD